MHFTERQHCTGHKQKGHMAPAKTTTCRACQKYLTLSGQWSRVCHCPASVAHIKCEYAKMQRACTGPTSGKPCQPALGKRQAWRQPISRRRPWLLWTAVEGCLRPRVGHGKDKYNGDVIFYPTLQLQEVQVCSSFSNKSP